jgi:hypothetical protein
MLKALLNIFSFAKRKFITMILFLNDFNIIQYYIILLNLKEYSLFTKKGFLKYIKLIMTKKIWSTWLLTENRFGKIENISKTCLFIQHFLSTNHQIQYFSAPSTTQFLHFRMSIHIRKFHVNSFCYWNLHGR